MDRLLRWVKDIKSATFFDIQNVSDYFWTYKDEEDWQWSDFTIAPPFPFFSTRYTLPDHLGPMFAGVENLTVFRLAERAPVSELSVTAGPDTDINPYPPTWLPDAKWHMELLTFGARGRRVDPPMTWFMAVDERGQLMRYLGHAALWAVAMQKPKPGQQVIGIIPNTFLQISFLALTFLHCRNVEVISPPPPTRKRLPRKLKFESRYHRLKVNAIGQRREARPAPGQPTGIGQALHIVRGHFREYGPEFGKGLLFGKYAGRYWVAAHTSGSLETGIVTKDYDVEAPE